MYDLIGQTLGQYRIIEQLGKGGMATVFKAFQPSLERYVAVKVLPPYFVHEEGFSERFVREAKAIARLDHPHILPIYDYGQQSEISYIVMKYVDAGTLKDQGSGTVMPLERATDIVAQIAEALDYAHEQGVIHRDVKPANILLDRGKWVFLMDFGLAKMIEGSQQLTASGVGVGTPAYMAPEQGQGRRVDGRADIYSLGIVLYEMLTGRVPYEAETPLAVVLKHVTEPLTMPRLVNSEIPEAVELVILKALAKEPDDRYQNAEEMSAAFRRAVEDATMFTGIEAWTPVSEAPVVPVPPVTTIEVPAEVVEPEPTLAAPTAVEVPAEAVASEPTQAAVEAPAEVAEPEPVPVVAETLAAAVEPEPVSTTVETPTVAVEPKPVPSKRKRRIPWWAYAVGGIVILVLIASVVLLAVGGLPGEPTPAVTSTTVVAQQPTATLVPAEPSGADVTPVPKGPGDVLRIGLIPKPASDVEASVKRLMQDLSQRMDIPVEVVPVGDPLELAELLRDRQLDAAFLGMPVYLWLRDDDRVALTPILYTRPIFHAEPFVHVDSDVRGVGDLRGRTVALVSWNAYAGILGRAALLDEGLNVDEECEAIYLAPDFEVEAGVRALRMVYESQVDAAIVSNVILEMAVEQVPEMRAGLRSLGESLPSSIGVVAVWSDMPPDLVSALRVTLEETDPELIRALTSFGDLFATKDPFAGHLADALAKVGLSAQQLVENSPPQVWSPSEIPPSPGSEQPPSGEIRIAMVLAAGTQVEGNRLNLPVFKGLQRASQEFDLELIAPETPEGGQPVDTALEYIDQGFNVVVAVGWPDPEPFWGLASEHPDVTFIDFGHAYRETLPNLVSFKYRLEEAGFLAGALAGKVSQSKRVAVVGGVPIPAIEQLIAGFESGVRHACPDCEPLVRITGSFTDLKLGEEVGRQAVEDGADVVFNAAGGLGSAAIRAAAQEGAWVIGVDWDEYYVAFRGGQVPNVDRLLGSVVRRADKQAFDVIARLVRGDLEPGNLVLGVAEEGIEFIPSSAAGHSERVKLNRYVKELIEGLRSGRIRP